MSFWRRLTRFLGIARDYSAEEKSAMEAGFGSSMLGRQLDRRKRLWAKEFEENAHLNAPFSRLATDVALNSWHLYKKSSSGKPREIHQHKALDLLDNPAPGYTRKSWLELLTLYLDLSGEFFLGIELDADGEPCCLNPIPPHWVLTTPSRPDPYYTVQAPGQAIRKIPPSWVIWHKTARPLNPYGRGAGKAQTLDDNVQQLDYMEQYNEAFFGNGCALGTVIGYEGAIKQEKLREAFETRHAGVANAHKMAFLPGKVTSAQAASHKDLDFVAGKKAERDIVRQTVGTPPEIHGQTDNSNKATAQAAENLHQAYGMRPRLEEQCQCFNRYLLPLFQGGEKLILKYENPVAKTDEFRLDRTERNTKSGIMTLNEGRAEQGLDPDPQGDVYFVPVNTRVIRREDLSKFAEISLKMLENEANSKQIPAKQQDLTSSTTSTKSLPGLSLDAYLLQEGTRK